VTSIQRPTHYKNARHDRSSDDWHLPANEQRICRDRDKSKNQPSSSSSGDEIADPCSACSDDRNVEARNDNEMKYASSLELSLRFGRQTRSATKHHTHHQASNIIVVKMPGDSTLNPPMDAIRAMPSTAKDRDQTRVPYRSCPVDAFAFEVLAKVEDSRVAIG
jgi:hypothetical protein